MLYRKEEAVAIKGKPIRRRTKGSIRKIAMIIAVSLAGVSTAAIISGIIAYDAFFPRYERPDYAIYPGMYCYERFEGTLKREILSVRSGEVDLAAYYYPVESQKGLVVVVHGMHSGADDYLPIIEAMVKGGYAVFAYDATGNYSSGGESGIGMCQQLRDLDAVLDFLASSEKYADMPKLLIGHSWGGFSTMCAPLYHPDVAHLVAISGFVSVDTIQSQIVPFLLAFSRGKLRSVEAKENPSYISSTATEALKRTDIPVLIIHSVDDKIVSYKKNFLPLKSALADKENVRFLTVNGKNHSPNYTDDATKYKDEFFASLKRAAKKKQLETQEQRNDFVASFDWYRMTEQDEAVWSHIFNTLDM